MEFEEASPSYITVPFTLCPKDTFLVLGGYQGGFLGIPV